jgi:ankyrin repeat protein
LWALIQACTAGDLSAVRALIARDPSLARAHYDYRKPLYFAVRENRIDVVRFLLEHDRNPLDLSVDDDPLEIARDRRYTEMEQLLTHTLETRFNASPKGEPIALALRDHDLRRMRELLDAQPALVGKGDQRSNQPIHWATMTRQLDAIAELLRRAADINAQRMDGARPIHLTNGDYVYRGWRDVPRNWPVTPADVMAHLKARGAFIDLPTACHTGDIERVRDVLLQDPSLANKVGEQRGLLPRRRVAAVKCRRGRTHGHRAVASRSRRRPQSARRAIAPKGKALYSAVYHGHYEIAKLLLERGAFPSPLSKARVTRCGCRGNGDPTSAWSSCSFPMELGRRRNTGMKTGQRARTTGCASRRSTRRRAKAICGRRRNCSSPAPI